MKTDDCDFVLESNANLLEIRKGLCNICKKNTNQTCPFNQTGENKELKKRRETKMKSRYIITCVFVVCFLFLSAFVFAGDEQGYSYRGGIDFQPDYYELPHASYSYGIGMGCEGFDLEGSFNALLSGEAVKDYLQGAAKSAISAAPMLLLEYASPTLADTLKHFQNRSQELLNLNYITCQDIMQKGEDKLAKLRKENQAQSIQKSGGGDLVATVQTTGQDTTLGNIPNYSGQAIGQSGKVKVVEEGLAWAKAPDDIKTVGTNVLGDVIIEGSGNIKYVEAQKTPNQLYVEERNTFQKDISSAVSRYVSSGKVNQSDLTKISLPAFPVNEVLIKSIGDMPQAKREMAVGKLASTLAHLKLLSEFNDLHFALLRATQNPVITPTTKEILQQKITLTETARKNLSLEKETAEEYFSRTANSIISEAEIDKTKSFGKVIETNKIPEGPAQNKWNWGGVKIE